MTFKNKFVLSINEASIYTGISKSTLKRLIKIDDFIEGIKITPRRVVYRKSDLENWINNRPKIKSEVIDKKKVRCPSTLLELNHAYKTDQLELIKNKVA